MINYRSEGLQSIIEKRSCGIENFHKWDAAKVVKNLYVGSIRSVHHPTALKSHNITHILTASDRLQVKIKKEDEIQHLVLKNLVDHPSSNILPYLEESLNFIDDAIIHNKTGILVHCASGISRSVSLCCAWLMLRKNYTYTDALTLVQQERRLALPNAGFQAQLRLLEQCNGDIPAASRKLKESLGNQSVTEIIAGQRDVANQIHAQVDNLENQIQSMTLMGGNSSIGENNVKKGPDGNDSNSDSKRVLLQTQLRDLTSLQSQIDQITLKLTNTQIEDRPARIIRKSALMKIERLIKELQEHQSKES